MADFSDRVEISGELQNVLVNGVDIAPLVDAELNRRMPERAMMRPTDSDGFRAAWVCRMILGNPSPWHPLDLPWDEAPGWDGIPWDRDVRPPLDDVVAVRRVRQAMVRDVMTALTDEQLATEVTRTEPGWPQIEGCPVKECLSIVLNEEWEHRLYAERDLTALEAEVS